MLDPPAASAAGMIDYHVCRNAFRAGHAARRPPPPAGDEPGPPHHDSDQPPRGHTPPVRARPGAGRVSSSSAPRATRRVTSAVPDSGPNATSPRQSSADTVEADADPGTGTPTTGPPRSTGSRLHSPGGWQSPVNGWIHPGNAVHSVDCLGSVQVGQRQADEGRGLGGSSHRTYSSSSSATKTKRCACRWHGTGTRRGQHLSGWLRTIGSGSPSQRPSGCADG